MVPANGGRLELRLVERAEECVRYSVALCTREADWSGHVRIGLEEGAIAFEPAVPAPLGWLLDVTRATLRALYRSHREDGAWPRRLTRWRPEPAQR